MEENKKFDFNKYRTATDEFVAGKSSIWDPTLKKFEK
jgi:hypothetical protein